MIAAIILAAGESRRMGSPKALLPCPENDGTESTFLAHLLGVFASSQAKPIVVVLGHDAENLVSSFRFGAARVVVNRDYRDGMLSSIHTGIRALDADDVDGALVCPVDHPDVDPRVVDTLIHRFEEHRSPIVVPVHNGPPGTSGALFERCVLRADGCPEDGWRAPGRMGSSKGSSRSRSFGRWRDGRYRHAFGLPCVSRRCRVGADS